MEGQPIDVRVDGSSVSLVCGRMSMEIGDVDAARRLAQALLAVTGGATGSSDEPTVGTTSRPPLETTGPAAARHGERWTPEEEELLGHRLDRGDPIDDIAGDLGRTPNAVRIRAEDLGLVGLPEGACPACGGPVDNTDTSCPRCRHQLPQPAAGNQVTDEAASTADPTMQEAPVQAPGGVPPSRCGICNETRAVDVVDDAPDACLECGRDDLWGCTRHLPRRAHWCSHCGHTVVTIDTVCPRCEELADRGRTTTRINMGEGPTRPNYALCPRHR